MAPISPEQFRQTIMAAVQQCSTRYTDAYSLSFRWEVEDTQAAQGAGHFQSLLQTIQLPRAHEVVLSASDPTPGWTVQGPLRQMLKQARATTGRASGDCPLRRPCDDRSRWNSFFFIGRQDGHTMHAEGLMSDHYQLPPTDLVDILFIFDCCYSYVACHAAETTLRIVEVIAATDEAAPRRQRNADAYFEFAEVVETLRARPDAETRPSHRLTMGDVSIMLPFSGPTTADPSRHQLSLRALFSVHIADHMTADQLARFVAWIRSLPEYASITVDGVYPTSSTLVVLSARYSVYSKLAGIHGYSLIEEVKGRNMLSQLYGFRVSLRKRYSN
ncbi:hypothetical protein BDW62DRAFT_211541 [Aspergillus aurantiobrunneus]